MRQAGSRSLAWGRRLGALLAFGVLSFATAFHGQEPAANLSPAQIAQAAIPSVVLIRTPTGQGSGFIAGRDGKVVTNYHVIRNAAEVTVVTSDGAEYKVAEVLALDAERDLVVLRTGARTLKPLTLGDSSLSKAGEHVVAIGNPLGLGDTVSDGLLSGLRDLAPNLSLLQISAPISPGSSGGPVFNDHGEVIGVSTLLLAGGQNLNFAIPINVVKTMLGSDRGKPLAAYVEAAPRRHIPDYPVSLLDQCPAPQLSAVTGAISRAIDVGAPLYNEGNFEACYRIYEGAALEVQRTVELCPGPKKALSDGVSRADGLRDYSAKAWAMRDAFDGVIAVIAKRAGGGGEFDAGEIRRHVPVVPASALDGCPSRDVAAIAGEIGAAINSGAPLYNDGNIEACVRIYRGAIGDIDRKFGQCPAARQVLLDGVRDADQRAGWTAKAWALRDSFDGLMNAIARREARRP